MAKRVWTYVGGRAGKKPSPAEKKAVSSACDTFIAERLTPKYLPEIQPSEEFNYPVAIHGKWHGDKYRFLTRYRSDGPNALAPEFDAPFARLDYVGPDLFDLFWHRHTGEWMPMVRGLSLAEALDLIATEGLFAPC